MKFSFITEVERIVEADSLEDLIKKIEKEPWDNLGYTNSEYAAYICNFDNAKIIKDWRK